MFAKKSSLDALVARVEQLEAAAFGDGSNIHADPVVIEEVEPTEEGSNLHADPIVTEEVEPTEEGS
jgi:hypothetical protein